MTNIMKQRLIGSLLMLLALAVVAIYLMQAAHQSVDKVIVQSEPTDLAIVDDFDEQLIKPELGDSVTKDAVTVLEPIDDPGVPKDQKLTDKSQPNWIIQLASFSVEKNAQSLLTQVKSLGYQANIDTVNTKNGVLYRLRVGPESDRNHIDQIVKDLTEKLKLKPQVIRNN